MMLAQSLGTWDILVLLLYLLVVVYLGFLGWRRTKTAADYLLAGRKAHPVIMALSYGATFISTSAIVGFGGVAALFGMSLLWLTFCNIFVGIFIAFVLLGGPTRHMGHRLDAHTFAELLGRRYDSRFVQVFAGLIIFLFMPLYAAAVLIGGCEFVTTSFSIDYNVALLIFSIVVAAYVIAGGLKGVMYTDALQGAIMFVGMTVLLIWTYVILGGPMAAHEGLAAAKDAAFGGFAKIGFKGWTQMPQFGWGKVGHELWWTVVTTIVLGVGIGVLAQPQLAVRFMTVKSKRELNRAVGVGGVFILMMTGVAFTVGALSNLYFAKHEVIRARIVETTESKVFAKKEPGLEAALPARLLHLDTTGDGKVDETIVDQGLGDTPLKLLPPVERTQLADGRWEIRPHRSGFTRAVVPSGDQWMFNPDSIIPTFVVSAMPKWFGLLFLLTLLAAAMSTLSSQFHTLGASLGRDVFEVLTGWRGKTVIVTRLAVIIGLVVAVIFGLYVRGGFIIARATAIFMGLCASAFLPAFVGGLFWRRATRAGAKASMIVGFLVTAFWLVFIKDKEARALGICKAITAWISKSEGVYSLLYDPKLAAQPSWYIVDPLVIALPISALVLIIVSLATRRPSNEHLARVFEDTKG